MDFAYRFAFAMVGLGVIVALDWAGLFGDDGRGPATELLIAVGLAVLGMAVFALSRARRR